jgi:hypothetical protein
MSIAKSQKNRKNFECKICDYITSNKYDFQKHIKTSKHKINELSIKSINLSMDLSQKSQEKKFQCQNCNKKYKDASGLWRHKQRCVYEEKIYTKEEIDYKEENEIINANEPTDKELIMLLIKENSEFKNMMMKVLENGTHNTTYTNSHNKSFNLQFFLNETCKDAMNIMDFVDSVKLQLSDLESVGKLGYVDGISNIIVKNLKALDVHKRPVHCTDSKREILYIKDDDKWEKEDEENKKIRKAIKKIATKNACLLPKFKEAHPDCSKSSSVFSDQYNKIIVESMGGSGDNDLEKEDKIIKNVAKQVVIDKEKYSIT